MSTTRHTIRLHLLCDGEHVGEVNQSLRESLGEKKIGFVLQEGDLWTCSGQWTEEEASEILHVCADLPVKVVRGEALGFSEEGSVTVRKGEKKPEVDESLARYTFDFAKDEWGKERAKKETPPLEGALAVSREARK